MKKTISSGFEAWSECVTRIFTPTLDHEDEQDRGQAEMMNFYLTRIIERRGMYEGEYDISQLRETYREIILSDSTKSEEEESKKRELEEAAC